jgi:ADP-ribose pyrophosphatase YjhB (NUDIX family)
LEKPYTDVWDKRKKIHDILAENRLKPDETLFIGDMAHDVETAHYGGVHSCAVLTGYNTVDQLRLARPELIVEHLSELRGILEKSDFSFKELQRRHEEANPPLATVGALIFNHAGKVLMIRTQKWSDLWGIPGGKIKWGEPSETALRREIKEETDLDVTDIKFVLVQDCIHSKEFYRDAHFVLLNYACRAVAARPAVVLNDEGREFRWLPPVEAMKLPLNHPTKILLEAVVRQSGAGQIVRKTARPARQKTVKNGLKPVQLPKARRKSRT